MALVISGASHGGVVFICCVIYGSMASSSMVARWQRKTGVLFSVCVWTEA